MKIGEDWIVLNGSVYLWNYHLNVFQEQQRFLPYLDTLKFCYESLINEKVRMFDPVLLWRIAYAYINALLQKYSVSKQQLIADAIQIPQYPLLLQQIIKFRDPKAEELLRAEQIADTVIPKMKPMQAKHIIALRTKIHYLLQKSPKLSGDKVEQLIVYDQMIHLPESQEKKIEYLKSAVSLLKENGNAELCSRFSIHVSQITHKD